MAEVGDKIGGKYRLERCLGTGGMGSVFLAIHEKIGKRVAIKFLLPKYVRNQIQVARFQREAKAAAAAGHPNIVDIFDIGTHEYHAPYLVMELLQGLSLGDVIGPTTPMDVPTTAYVVCQVLSALDSAHAAGVVHRDLKPDNVFLVDKGASLPDVKLLDFGISHMADASNDTENHPYRLTKTGVVMGTPYYMSPEQASGRKDLDHRTDLYSTGVLLYECVTGQLPHNADNYHALLASILTEEPPSPLDLEPELPPRFAAVIQRAMNKDPGRRYPSASAMLDDLLPFVSERAQDSVSLPLAALELPEPQPVSPPDGPTIVEAEQRWATPTSPAQKPDEAITPADEPELEVSSPPADEVEPEPEPPPPDEVIETQHARPIEARQAQPKGRRRLVIALGLGAIVGLLGVVSLVRRTEGVDRSAASVAEQSAIATSTASPDGAPAGGTDGDAPALVTEAGIDAQVISGTDAGAAEDEPAHERSRRDSKARAHPREPAPSEPHPGDEGYLGGNDPEGEGYVD
jgi:serine/threonine-protein kinase